MTNETFYTWVLPIGIAAFGWLYAIWAARTYDRAVAREELERAQQSVATAGE